MPAAALLEPAEIRETHPAQTRGMDDVELWKKLVALEATLRSDYAVTRTDDDSNAALRIAMEIAWVPFLHALQNVRSITAGTDMYREDRGPTGGWPLLVDSLLAPFGDARTAPPSVTVLVR